MTAYSYNWWENPKITPARERCPACEGSLVQEEYGQQVTCECCEGSGVVWADEFPDEECEVCGKDLAGGHFCPCEGDA